MNYIKSHYKFGVFLIFGAKNKKKPIDDIEFQNYQITEPRKENRKLELAVLNFFNTEIMEEENLSQLNLNTIIVRSPTIEMEKIKRARMIMEKAKEKKQKKNCCRKENWCYCWNRTIWIMLFSMICSLTCAFLVLFILMILKLFSKRS